MAGPYYPTLYFTGKDGSSHTIGLHCAGSDAANAWIELAWDRPALSTSPQSCKIPVDGWITDFVLATSDHPATGIIEVVSNTKKTGIMLNCANHTIANTGRPKLSIPLAKGTDFRLLVSTALEA